MKTTIIGMLLSPFLLIAQQSGGAWTNIGPSPAAVDAFAVDQQGMGTVFMGTITGGVRKSVDHGITWSAANTGLTNLAVLALAMDASGPQTVYAGALVGLFKTGDGGATWQNLPAISGILSLAADPKRSGVVYAAAFNNLANGSIRKSIDGGVTWATIFPTTAAIFNITIDPGNSDVLYAPTVGHGAFKSTDGGQRWSPMPALTPAAIWTLALDPANSQVLYAGTNENGVWKSSDAGTTWQQVGSPDPFPVYSLAVDPSVAHTIYAGTNGGGVWTSSDGGVTWHSTGVSAGMVLSLAVDSAGVLYAGTNFAGGQVSRDLGATWSVLHAGIDGVSKFGYNLLIDPSNGRKMIIGSGEGLWGLGSSQDGGATWSDAGQGFTGHGTRGVAFDPTDSRRIYAGSPIGSIFFKSTDGGLTWSRRRFGSPAVYVIAVAVDPLSPNIIYVGTQNEGIFKTSDYGDTWKSTGSAPSGSITYLTPDPTKSGRLFASTGTAFYLSEDSGETWTNVLNMPAWTVTIDPNKPSTVYATARTQGVFRSFDGGHTWRGINTGITKPSMGRSAPVIIDPSNPQTLYVGGEGGGVFKSLDAGDHWFAVNSGLDELTVIGLAMDPSNPAVLYACGPNGVYKTVTGAEVQSAPTISAVLNGASLLPGAVSPGEIVILSGSGLGPDQLIPATPGTNGLYNAQLSGTTVQFNGTSAPVIYTSATQVAVQVPESIPTGTATIVVTYAGRASASFPVQVTQYAPGIFTLDLTGKGQAVAVNQDGTINIGSTPARLGDVISVYATGVGEGDLTVRIGSQSAPLTSTKKIGGVVQIGVRLPGGIQTGSVVPVVLQVGNTSSQPGVTIAVLPPNLTQSPGTFAATGHMITPRSLHTATLLLDGRVLVAGGDSSYSATTNGESSAELYDPVTGTFVATGSMTTPRDGHSATLLPNGKVLIAGGGPRINGRGYSLASAELYDPATGTFSATGSMTVERSSHTATLLNDGKVLIAGGVRIVIGGSPSGVTFPTSAELYDPATGAFTPTGDTHGRFVDTATLLTDGKVLITSGNPDAGPYLSSAELYDPSTGKFTSAGYLNVNHTGPSATLLMNGKVLIAGGDIGDGASVIAELYDPATGKFTATGRLTTGREQNATTLLPDGTVLFAGGHGGVPVPGGGYDNLASAEIYNPLGGTFSAAGAMLTGRDILGATLLNNGQVLITGGNQYYPFGAGGRDPQHPVVSQAELYTPAMPVPAPALFSLGGDGRGQGAISHATTGEIASLSSPAVAGEVLTMYTTSLADRGVIPPQVAIGGRLAEVLYYGSAPGYPGYYQVNFRVPNGVAPGPAVPVRLTYLGRPSNAVTIGVR